MSYSLGGLSLFLFFYQSINFVGKVTLFKTLCVKAWNKTTFVILYFYMITYFTGYSFKTKCINYLLFFGCFHTLMTPFLDNFSFCNPLSTRADYYCRQWLSPLCTECMAILYSAREMEIFLSPAPGSEGRVGACAPDSRATPSLSLSVVQLCVCRRYLVVYDNLKNL